jgi:hypothetical protein
MSASLASPAHFQKRPFWRVLKFDKFAVEWPLLTFETFDKKETILSIYISKKKFPFQKKIHFKTIRLLVVPEFFKVKKNY